MSYYNTSITNLEDVVTLLQQQNELITSQNTAISNLSDKVNALSVASSGSGIKQVIRGTFKMSGEGNYKITHTSVNINKSFIIIDGNGYSSNNENCNTGMYISSRTSTSFLVTSAYIGSITTKGDFSYQIVEFN